MADEAWADNSTQLGAAAVTASRPFAFDSYRHRSAVFSNASALAPCSGKAATPIETVIDPRSWLSELKVRRFSSVRKALARTTAFCKEESGKITANSSPPCRQQMSEARKKVSKRLATDWST